MTYIDNPYEDEAPVEKELTDVEYLRDLAERIMHIPVMHGTDDGDSSRLHDIASRLEILIGGRLPSV